MIISASFFLLRNIHEIDFRPLIHIGVSQRNIYFRKCSAKSFDMSRVRDSGGDLVPFGENYIIPLMKK